MSETQLTARQHTTLRATGLLAALALGLLIPNLGMPQWVTGPLVNALLLTIALQLGATQALIVGIVTPMAALLRGVLPLPLAIMIPFVALANALYVTVFGRIKIRSRWLALGIAAVTKYALLQSAILMLAWRPLALAAAGGQSAIAIPNAIATMMGWPQLLTALAGGLIALGINGLQNRARDPH